MENVAWLVPRAPDLEFRAEVFIQVISLITCVTSGKVCSWFQLDYNLSCFPLTYHNYRNTTMNLLENLQPSIRDFIRTNKQFQETVLYYIPMTNLQNEIDYCMFLSVCDKSSLLRGAASTTREKER